MVSELRPKVAPLLSVVAPCFNEEATLGEFHRRVTGACEDAGIGDDCEIVLVNDGSRDGTWRAMQALGRTDRRVVAINLARNYGHQIALSAGLQHCRGRRVLVIDADLQDPPELLGAMLRAMDEHGADVVYGQRRHRAGETRFKTWTAAIFYRVLRRLVDVDFPVDAGDFRLISRRALDALNRMPEQHRFIRGMVSWIGLKQIPLLYDREPRFAGSTGYSLGKMIHFALDAVTGFSIVPLRLASCLGAILAAISLLLLTYSIGSWLTGHAVAGWTSLISIMLVVGSVQLLVLGVFGEYLGRLYVESKRRPLFIVESVVSAESGVVVAPAIAAASPWRVEPAAQAESESVTMAAATSR